MRPGLDKPGALPLLIVLIFSLLTLAPSLSNIYNLKLTDFSFNTHGARHMPLINEPVAEFPSDMPPISYSASWTMTAQYRPRGNLLSRSVRSGNNAPTLSGELASVENKSELSHGAVDSSFMFSRRARAFRTYFIQQLDDYQIFTPFSNRSLSPETAHLAPTTPPSNLAPRPTSLNEPSSGNKPHLNNEPTPSDISPTNWPGLQLSPLFGMWQQACRAATRFWRLGPESLAQSSSIPWNWDWSSIESLATSDKKNPTRAAIMPQPQDPQARANATSNQPAQTSKPNTFSHNETTDAAIRTAPELKGSCMAVVIGLVVGIMWF
ncbi:hypothetical protein N7481_002305 [Penicillium waksmanii]|uniref:uncharacterized protein n=1 Tax=Penicillium waksmanii TaxID=69791 RepID=UPI002547189E|nr:uncharacterized protein N7481_002305 [Penicillium waksmanii]KAJ5995328.1 hypothetical protein N7481_002305 [Penicillium waksmanii]